MSIAETIAGQNLVAGAAITGRGAKHTATDPRTGEPGRIAFADADQAMVDAAAAAAAAAHRVLRSWPTDRLAALLAAVAGGLDAAGDALVATADAETALGEARLVGELGRTTGQLRSFASLVGEGSHVDAVIDRADPAATPPRPDLRRMLVPIGPVAVFGASNFPLAFSVPGGDTASALAAGCPVVVKGHPSHPATSELCGRVISDAVAASGAPPGTFSLLHGRSPEVGRALVAAPPIQAVGFTGSLRGGRALFDLAAARPVPIPVYAEMGSLNPVFVTPAALASRGPAIAAGFVASMTLGTGQFCTKPGLVFVPDGEPATTFTRQVADALAGVPPAPMLDPGIVAGLESTLGASLDQPGVEVVVAGSSSSTGLAFGPVLLATDVDTLTATPELTEEHFGPVAVIVRTPAEAMAPVAAWLPGNLTATVHAEAGDDFPVAELVEAMTGNAGRVVYNGFPTGVAVTAAQHHGGPYPASTFPAHTSVGLAAIRRFLRPVAYQDLPDPMRPAALQDANPLGIHRWVGGTWTAEPV
jgi:NADP-dependent aldehyde dehydrogenase